MNRLTKDIKEQLHIGFGIDWQQKDLIKIYKGDSNFTIKKLVKDLELKKDTLKFIFIQYNCYKWYFVMLDENFEIKIPHIDTNIYLDTYTSKASFNNDRKMFDCNYIVIEVDKKAVNEDYKKDKTKQLQFDFEWIDETIRLLDVEPDKRYTSRIHFTYNYCGKKNTFDTWIGQGCIGNIKNITNDEFIDKSGYCLYKYRRDLSIRLEKYKLNKAKDMVINSNFVADNNKKIEELLLKKREELIKKMVVADNEKRMFEIVSLSTKLTKYYGHFTKIKEKTKSMFDDTLREWHKFTTIDELQQVYKEFIEELEA